MVGSPTESAASRHQAPRPHRFIRLAWRDAARSRDNRAAGCPLGNRRPARTGLADRHARSDRAGPHRSSRRAGRWPAAGRPANGRWNDVRKHL